MPAYDFKCSVCSNEFRHFMSISEYKSFMLNDNTCISCNGTIVRVVNSVLSEVEKTKDQIIEEAKEYAVKTVKKIIAKDERTIRDIYGSTPNPHKK